MESVRLRLLLVAPLRFVLALGVVAGARAAGANGDAALLLFAAGALGTTFAILQDPRARLRRASNDPQPLPAGAQLAPRWLHAAHAALPSTVGVTVLAVVALLFEASVAALLAGILAGLGLAALVAVYGVDPRLYYEPSSGSLFLEH